MFEVSDSSDPDDCLGTPDPDFQDDANAPSRDAGAEAELDCEGGGGRAKSQVGGDDSLVGLPLDAVLPAVSEHRQSPSPQIRQSVESPAAAFGPLLPWTLWSGDEDDSDDDQYWGRSPAHPDYDAHDEGDGELTASRRRKRKSDSEQGQRERLGWGLGDEASGDEDLGSEGVRRWGPDRLVFGRGHVMTAPALAGPHSAGERAVPSSALHPDHQSSYTPEL